MIRTTHHRWLTRYAWLTAMATLVLICFGGLVTSKGAGLAVPDWPNSYGYNMFFFPVSMWVGGVFYEHTHRLVASAVGLMTTVLAVWLWCKDSRRWLRWLGVAAFVGVVVQGVLGGLRVTMLNAELGIVHGAVAQLFLLLVAAIALFTSRWWQRLRKSRAESRRGPVLWFVTGTLLVLIQLILGATMRHQHAGLAIPDFPLAYGRLWPATDSASVELYNQLRMEVNAAAPITAVHVVLQMIHRIFALLILAVAALAVRSCAREAGRSAPATRIAAAWVILVVVQGALGAFTIWTGKSADIATAHVAVGAVTLVTAGLGTMVAIRTLPGAWPQIDEAPTGSLAVVTSS